MSPDAFYRSWGRTRPLRSRRPPRLRCRADRTAGATPPVEGNEPARSARHARTASAESSSCPSARPRDRGSSQTDVSSSVRIRTEGRTELRAACGPSDRVRLRVCPTPMSRGYARGP